MGRSCFNGSSRSTLRCFRRLEVWNGAERLELMELLNLAGASRLTAMLASPTVRAMPSITALFGMERLAPAKARALGIVYAASISLMMGVNFIQPALPALTEAFQVSDAQLSWVMTLFTAPAIVLSPIFGVIADLHGRRETRRRGWRKGPFPGQRGSVTRPRNRHAPLDRC